MLETMRAALEFLTPALDELSLTIKDHHAVGLFACGMNSVMNVDVALGVRANAMCVAVLNVSRKVAP